MAVRTGMYRYSSTEGGYWSLKHFSLIVTKELLTVWFSLDPARCDLIKTDSARRSGWWYEGLVYSFYLFYFFWSQKRHCIKLSSSQATHKALEVFWTTTTPYDQEEEDEQQQQQSSDQEEDKEEEQQQTQQQSYDSHQQQPKLLPVTTALSHLQPIIAQLLPVTTALSHLQPITAQCQ